MTTDKRLSIIKNPTLLYIYQGLVDGEQISFNKASSDPYYAASLTTFLFDSGKIEINSYSIMMIYLKAIS